MYKGWPVVEFRKNLGIKTNKILKIIRDASSSLVLGEMRDAIHKGCVFLGGK